MSINGIIDVSNKSVNTCNDFVVQVTWEVTGPDPGME